MKQVRSLFFAVSFLLLLTLSTSLKSFAGPEPILMDISNALQEWNQNDWNEFSSALLGNSAALEELITNLNKISTLPSDTYLILTITMDLLTDSYRELRKRAEVSKHLTRAFADQLSEISKVRQEIITNLIARQQYNELLPILNYEVVRLEQATNPKGILAESSELRLNRFTLPTTDTPLKPKQLSTTIFDMLEKDNLTADQERICTELGIRILQAAPQDGDNNNFVQERLVSKFENLRRMPIRALDIERANRDFRFVFEFINPKREERRISSILLSFAENQWDELGRFFSQYGRSFTPSHGIFLRYEIEYLIAKFGIVKENSESGHRPRVLLELDDRYLSLIFESLLKNLNLAIDYLIKVESPGVDLSLTVSRALSNNIFSEVDRKVDAADSLDPIRERYTEYSSSRDEFKPSSDRLSKAPKEVEPAEKMGSFLERMLLELKSTSERSKSRR